MKEHAVKKKILSKDPAQKRLKEKERKSARRVRAIGKRLGRKQRRLNRIQSFKVKQLRRSTVKRLRHHEHSASKLLKQYAHKMGIRTIPTVHFRAHQKKAKKSPEDKYVPLHYSTATMVKETREAFSPHQAHHDASTAVKHVMAAEAVQED